MAKGAAKKASDVFVWIILALLIVGLAGFGAVNFGGQVRSIGQVGDTEISVDRYAQAIQQELRMLQAQTGQPFSFAQGQAFGLDRIVLQRVLAATALENEAASIGLSVGDAAVQREVLRIPAFQGLDGSFDREAYSFALNRSGQSVAEFEQSIRDETARTLLQGALVAGVRTPATFTDTLFDYARQQRTITYVPLRAGDLTDPIPEPTEAEQRAYYDENPEEFTTPERRRLTYAWVTPQMLIETVAVDETALRQLYEARLDQYVKPERRLVERLVFGDESEATAARERIDAGEVTFDDLVEARGLDLEDVDLGDLSRRQLGQAAETVFALDEPGIAGPAPTDLGPALFRVNAILSAQEITFEEAEPELRGEYAEGAARRLVQDQIEPAEDLLAGGATLEELAAESELQLGTILLDDNSDAPIAGYDVFRRAAEAVDEGDFPEILELSDGGIFALRLDEIVPPELQPFEDVQVAVIQAWEQAEIAKALQAQAEALEAAMDAGEPLDEASVSPVTREDLLRDAFIEGTPVDMVTTAFEMEPGETRVLSDATGAFVLRLDTVTAPEVGTEEAQTIRDGFAEQTAQGLAQDMATAFTRAVETEAGIQLDQGAINAVHAQFP